MGVMRIGIGQRIFLGFLLTALLVLGLTTGITRWSFDRGFLNYVNESEAEALRYYAIRLAGAYGDEGGWESVGRDRDRWLELMAPPGTTSTGTSRNARCFARRYRVSRTRWPFRRALPF